MIEEILSPAAVVEEASGDPLGVALFPDEEAVLGNAVEKRRREFTTARLCARRALARLDLPSSSIPAGPRGEPRWPAGVVGSITHCQDYRACAVARATDLLTIGIDAEPHDALPEGVLGAIASPEERSRLRELARIEPMVHWDRLLFSAKESVYKAWYPLTRHRLGFEDATLAFDLAKRAFSAHLLVPAPPLLAGASSIVLPGRWLVRDGLVLTATAPVA